MNDRAIRQQLGVEPSDLMPAYDPSDADSVECDSIRQLLTIAGANVSVESIKPWSRAQRDEAITWARAQLAAWSKDRLGYQTSVFWPEHVSVSHVERGAA